jgi:hypothetical protein
MKRLPWKYLAGFIDGEGCIDVQISPSGHVRPRLRIGLAANAEYLLDMMQNSLGGNKHRRFSKNPNWQDAVALDWSGYKQSCMVLRNVVNHLFLKKEQARFCLWLEANVKGKQVSTEVRDAIREELKLMKRDPHRLSERAQERIAIAMLQSAHGE